ncbi:MAG: hypothetical protein OJF62_003263 [Pseudolabrys sp.]|nr:hypothetical protein [Pseudolabrys sp.]
MRSVRPTFAAGLLIGAVMGGIALPVGTELPASLSPPATAGASMAAHFAVQQVNRADKADRLVPLHPVRRATDNARGRPVIPDGCDAAFSPLSRGASENFAGRCLS